MSDKVEQKHSQESNEQIFPVKGSANCASLASSVAIAHRTNPEKQIVLQYVGASACNQSIKAILLVNKYISNDGEYVTALPAGLRIDGLVVFQLRLKFHKI